MDKRPDNDKPEGLSNELLEEYLDGETQLSQAYRDMGQPEPPPTLDRAILKQARKEAQPPLLDTGSAEFWQRWMRPLTMVVTMGVCLAVVLQIMDYATLAPNEMQELQATVSKEAAQESGRNKAMLMQMAPQPSDPADVVQFASPADRKAKTGTRANAPASGGNIEEMVIVRRERAETLQDVPMAITAFSADEFDMPESEAAADQEIVVTARKAQAEPGNKPAVNALEAWANGARPAAKVWLAGIQVLLDEDEPQSADLELDHMARVYPDAVAEFREGRLSLLDANRSEKDMAAANAPDLYANTQLEEIAVSERKDAAPDATAELADAWVWAEGINWLYGTGAKDEANAELEKFRLIYPQFEF